MTCNAVYYEYDQCSLAKLHTNHYEDPCTYVKIIVKMSDTFLFGHSVYLRIKTGCCFFVMFVFFFFVLLCANKRVHIVSFYVIVNVSHRAHAQ